MILKRLRTLLLVAGLVLAVCQPSYADLIMRITTDNGGDSDETPITSGTPIPIIVGGIHFNLTATTITAPGSVQMIVDGTAGYPYGGSVPFVTIGVSNTGFTLPTGPYTFTTTFTGFTPGVAGVTSILNPSDVSFATTGCTPGPLALNAIGTFPCSITGPFSLTQTITFTLPSGQTANFAVTSAVPEPSTMLLFGIGLLGARVLGRKRFAK